MKKIILSILFILLIAVIYSGWQLLGPVTHVPEGKFFYVKTNSSYEDVKKELTSQEIINSEFWFDFLANRLHYTNAVKAGKYEVRKGMSLLSLIRMLRNGQQTPVKLVITKLRTTEDLARKAGSLFEFDSLQMMNYLSNPDSLSKFSLDTNTLMSAVIPDTYTFFWNTTPDKVFSKLFAASQNFWTEERIQKAKDHGLTPVQAYTLASILEEETNSKPDKPNIASVYLNRIAKGMPLQADPTIKFAMKNFGLKRIYDKYLLTPSPYNTYTNKGLPPGPICTPSQETIDEVLNSPKTDYLYFVAKSDFSGTHVFTTNFKDHLKYAKEFQKAMDKQDSIRNHKEVL
ncbi:MAG: endolytic transglycosylase MltG [Bacteroidetes bacterium]|nr:endolytic transglycosylase MltG [Bacteroidota bacterium]